MTHDLTSFKRTIAISLLLVILVLSTAPVQAFIWRGDYLKITIRTVDQQGKPIPWVTVGAAQVPQNIDTYKISTRPFLSVDDPYRILLRTSDSWEYWNRFNSPVRYLEYPGITNERGELTWMVDINDMYKRNPGGLSFGFAAYRHGLDPAQTITSARNRAEELEVTLVLNKNSSFQEDLPNYLLTFYEAKYDLNDHRRNANMTMDNYHRLENMRLRLIEAAEQAHKADDSRSAGLIMYWVANMPKIKLRQGNPSGFDQSFDFYSDQDFLALEKAVKYDPNNYHLVSQYMVKQSKWFGKLESAGHISYAEYQRRRRNWIDEAEKLVSKAGNTLWPNFHDLLASRYAVFKLFDKYIEQLIFLKDYEPRWEHAERYEKRIKRAQKNTKKYKKIKGVK